MALLDETRVRPRPREERWPAASEDALIHGAVAGTDGAFDEIFARYHAPLVRYCRGILLDDHLAQDAAQNALASALRALRGGTTPRVLGAWLYKIAQREAFDLSRRRRQDASARQHDNAGEEALLQVAAPSDERTRERLRELVGDLARLPLRQRSALLLRELSGLGYGDIAVALDTTPAAARQSVLEARTALVDVGAGRQESCAAIRALIDSGDRRRLRGRRTQAHLEDCMPCAAFAARIDDRRRDLALLFPLPVALAGGGGALAVAAGGTAVGGAAALAGGAAVTGGAGVAAGGWTLGGLGAAKCAIACTAALVGVGAIGETVVHPPHRTPPAPKVVAQAPQPQASDAMARSATATSTPAAAPRATATAPARHTTKTAAARKAVKAPKPRRQVAARMPAATSSSSAGAGSSSAGHGSAGSVASAPTTPTAAAPAPTVTPATTTPAQTTPARPATTPATTAPKAGSPVADALKQRITETTTALAEQARQTVAQTLTGTQQTLDAVNKTVQQVTSQAMSQVQTRLQAIKALLHPDTQTPPQ